MLQISRSRLSAFVVFLVFSFFLVPISARGNSVRIELWPGVTLAAPAGSVATYRPTVPGYTVSLPSGREIDVDKWRMRRAMWSFSNRQVAQAFRDGERKAKRFTMRVRGRRIVHRRLTRQGWFYEVMFRAKPSEFVQAKTWIPRKEWNTPSAKEVRAVVESLKIR